MKIAFTSPDMGDLYAIPEGTILRYVGCGPDDAPKRKGWYWREFEVLGYPNSPITDLDFSSF